MGKTGINEEDTMTSGYVKFDFEIVRKRHLAIPDTLTVLGVECEGIVYENGTPNTRIEYIGTILTENQEVGWIIKFYYDNSTYRYTLEWRVDGCMPMGRFGDYDNLMTVQDFEMFIQQAVQSIESTITRMYTI